MPPLDGRVALVTGAGSGIGRATALRLAADGTAVACLGLGEDALSGVAEEIGRFLAPEEIVASIAFLAGPGRDACVGHALSPNGGAVFPG